MHVSMQTRYVSEATTRVQARRRLEDGDSGREMRRILENPNEGRRQGTFSRRPRPNTPRPRDIDDYSAEIRPSAAAQPLSNNAKTAEFWTLLGAVAPDEVPPGAGEHPISVSTKRELSLDELLARAIAAH